MSNFRKVARLGELSDDCGHTVEVDGHSIGLFRSGKQVFALNALCPHRSGPLGEGELDGDVVICPWHGWEFEARTGECLTDPAFKVRCYRVRVDGDDVSVAIE